MRLIRYSRLAAAPWKSGVGETREIALHPSRAGFDDFDWRLSIATIAEDGAFSTFPGIDRTLILLGGKGVILRLDDESEHVLRSGECMKFAGEQTVRSLLLEGAVQDLNIMFRRSRVTTQIRIERLHGRTILDLGTDASVGLSEKWAGNAAFDLPFSWMLNSFPTARTTCIVNSQSWTCLSEKHSQENTDGG